MALYTPVTRSSEADINNASLWCPIARSFIPARQFVKRMWSSKIRAPWMCRQPPSTVSLVPLGKTFTKGCACVPVYIICRAIVPTQLLPAFHDTNNLNRYVFILSAAVSIWSFLAYCGSGWLINGIRLLGLIHMGSEGTSIEFLHLVLSYSYCQQPVQSNDRLIGLMDVCISKWLYVYRDRWAALDSICLHSGLLIGPCIHVITQMCL